MAEIRKHTPSKGGDIAQALAKALGEPVRPVAPGAGDKPAPKKPRTPAAGGPRVTSTAIWDPFLGTQPKVARSAGSAPREVESEES